MSKIPENLIEKIKNIPSKPGVYQMKDRNGKIIYIGKSKTLQSRVKSYFYTEHKQTKIKQMLFYIQDIDIIVTDTHLEAQVLECILIKKIKPIYNSQFKNDEKYVYLKIESNNRAKPLTIVNEREDEHCIGPYRSRGRLMEVIKFFENIYPIINDNQTYKFKYKIFPEALGIEDFKKNRESLIEIFFKEEYNLKFLSAITEKMKAATLELQFETAAIYRDMLVYVKYLYEKNSNEIDSFKATKLMLAEEIEEGYKLFYISNNKMILKKKYKKLTSNIVAEFLQQAQEREARIKPNLKEKRDLDFKKIISREIKEKDQKEILLVEGNYCIDEFINNFTLNKGKC